MAQKKTIDVGGRTGMDKRRTHDKSVVSLLRLSRRL